MTIRHSFATTLTGLAFAGLSLSACDSFVSDVDPLIDRVPSDSLDTQDQVAFTATGVKQSFNSALDVVTIAAELLSDAAAYDQRVQNASFPSYGEIDRADILLINNTVRGVFNAVNEYRYQADDLGRRATETITFSDDPDTPNVDEGAEARRLALFTANFHGGVSRYMLATYFGLDPAVGGAPVSTERDAAGSFIPGPVIPSDELYRQAIQKYTAAVEFAGTDYNRRLINTLIARAYLFLGDRTQAGTFAANGLVSGDAPYTGNYATTSSNDWFFASGPGRTQFVAAQRFADYVATGDPRTPVARPTLVSGTPATVILYRQALYTAQTSPIVFASWQENNLIRAEAALLGSGSAAAALPFVNAVRAAASASLPALTTIDQAGLIVERDKSLFTQGQRLVDQRRFNLFHDTTPSSTGPVALGPFRYLPIPTDERDANPNL